MHGHELGSRVTRSTSATAHIQSCGPGRATIASALAGAPASLCLRHKGTRRLMSAGAIAMARILASVGAVADRCFATFPIMRTESTGPSHSGLVTSTRRPPTGASAVAPTAVLASAADDRICRDDVPADHLIRDDLVEDGCCVPGWFVGALGLSTEWVVRPSSGEDSFRVTRGCGGHLVGDRRDASARV